MTTSITRLAKLLCIERATPGGPAKTGRWSVGLALCTLALLAAAPAYAQAQSSLVSWGSDSYGEVSGTPAGTYTAVATGSAHITAIRTDGTLVSWGRDYPIGLVSGTPDGTFSAVAAGDIHSVALHTDGTLESWGDDTYGQVSDTPDGTYVAVAAGYSHSVAVRTDGTLVSWGLNDYGQVSGTPGGDDYKAVAAGARHCVALRTDGTLVSWGRNDEGQVSDTPDGVFSTIAAGGFYSVAITPATAQQQITYLSLSVQALVDDSVSLPADGQALLAKLDAALGANNALGAIGNLIAFINQVEAFVGNGKLTPAQGQNLIDAAWLIITELVG